MLGRLLVKEGDVCMKLVENLFIHSNWREMNSRNYFEIMKAMQLIIILEFRIGDTVFRSDVIRECVRAFCMC